MHLLLLAALFAATIPPLHHDPDVAPAAWVAATDGHLWLCWEGPLSPHATPDATCWERVPLELAAAAEVHREAPIDTEFSAPDSAAFFPESAGFFEDPPDEEPPWSTAGPSDLEGSGELRVGFRDASSLWVFAPARGTWIVGRDGLTIAITDAPGEVELEPLLPLPCSPGGWLPQRDDRGRWSWLAAPCEPPPECRQRPRIRRRPTGIRLDLGIDLAIAHRWNARGEAEVAGRRESQVRGQALLLLRLHFDHRRASLDRQALARWNRPGHERDHGMPPPRSRGVLAPHEREALRRAQCLAWEGIG